MHIVFCVVILAIPMFAMSTGKDWDSRFYINYLLRVGSLILVFYINYLYLIDNFLFKRKFVAYFSSNILIAIAMVLLHNTLSEVIWIAGEASASVKQYIDGARPKPPPIEFRMIGDFSSMILFIGMSVALKATTRWYKDSINLEAIKASQLEADLRNLRSQLNPHFLFNTLNNIYSLVVTDTKKAQESIYRLSNLLRFVLYDNNDKFIPVDKELGFTQNYIDLMKLRLSQNINLNVLIKGNDCKNKVASLMFITLIENAFKHGISSKKESFIDIKIYVEKSKGILCTVENSIDKSENDMETENSGIGLVNLRKRLKLLYPDNHQFEVNLYEDRFSVLLRIDFDDQGKE